MFFLGGVAFVLMGGVFLLGARAQQSGLLSAVVSFSSPRTIRNYVNSFVSGNSLPVLRFDMKFKHFQKIEKKRQGALNRGILLTSDEDMVPAELTVGDRTVRVKMRLKGDWVDHLSTDKWSYRIHVRGGENLFGMRRFSIQHPMTRGYLSEWAFLENARMEGLIAPRYRFVNVIFNGTAKGVYALEEHFAKEMLEACGRRESGILKFDENPTWLNRAGVGATIDEFAVSGTAPESFRLASIDVFGSGRLESNEVLGRMRDAGISLLRDYVLGRRTAAEVFDVELMGRYLALTDLWLADHALIWHNFRFYYNPITARLEPIAFDAHPREARLHFASENDQPLVRALLADPEVSVVYVESLARLSAPDYLTSLHNHVDLELDGLMSALHREWPALESPFRPLGDARRQILGSLAPARVADAYVRSLSVVDPDSGSSALVLDVENLISLPIEIGGYRINGQALVSAVAFASEPEGDSAGHSVIVPPAGMPRSPGRVRLQFSREAYEAVIAEGTRPTVTVVARLVGQAEWRAETARVVLGGPRELEYPTVDAVLARHPFLERGPSAGELSIRAGEWSVEGDLVLPRGVELRVDAGTTLRFDRGAGMFATGALLFRGTAEEPVVLEPSDGSWAGLVVDRARGRSHLEHVVIRDTAGIDRQGWVLTGGVTFYESPVTLTHCRLAGSAAEDAINVIHAEFEFIDSEFGPCASDAFDGDFVTGSIVRCAFHDIAGDAVDVSGSEVELADLNFRRVVDKAISSGERSRVTGVRLTIDGAGIGVASKDRSETVIEELDIRNARIGLAAYVKKAEYGSAEIRVRGVSMRDVERRTLVQEGSRVKLNGQWIEGEPLDIKDLYARGILGN